MIISVDGLSGTGTKETAQQLAKKFGCDFLSVSTIYRVVALNAVDYGISWKEEDRIKDMLAYTNIKLKKDSKQNALYLLNGDNVTDYVYHPQVNFHVGDYAQIPVVREFVENFVKNQAKTMENFVCEGRDAKNILFPQAELKVFLTSDIEKRAEKRTDILKRAGKKVNLKDVKSSLIQKDLQHKKNGRNRCEKSKDVVVIDVTSLTVDDTVQKICDLLNEARQKKENEFYNIKSSCRSKNTNISLNGLDTLKF